ncbi:MAG: magnesium transporter CorA family protein [Gammaproteobacteria bacterium]|nr:magnesium transporter CorA family protein [Gammaproteobacteria bacterium]
MQTIIDGVAAAVHALASERPGSQPATPDPQVGAVILDAEGRPLKRGGVDLAKTLTLSDGSWLWVDIEGSVAVAEPVLAALGVERPAIRSALQPEVPPTATGFGDTLLVVYHEFITSPAITHPLAVFVTDRFVATCHASPSPTVAALTESLGRPASPTSPQGLALATGRLAATHLLDAADRYEPTLDDIEDRVFGDPDDTILEQLTAFKRELRLLARTGRSHERIAGRLEEHPDPEHTLQHERDLDAFREQSHRLLSLATMHAGTAGDLTDGYLAMSAHRLNRVMQILTVITVIFVPLTLLAGIYGMNFQNMPELTTRNGYFVILTVMFVAVVIQAFFFRRKRWI